jgi:hypothetical protein
MKNEEIVQDNAEKTDAPVPRLVLFSKATASGGAQGSHEIPVCRATSPQQGTWSSTYAFAEIAGERGL